MLRPPAASRLPRLVPNKNKKKRKSGKDFFSGFPCFSTAPVKTLSGVVLPCLF